MESMTRPGATRSRARVVEPEILPPEKAFSRNTFQAIPSQETQPVQINVEINPVIPVRILPDNSWVRGRQQLLIFLIIAMLVAVLLGYLMSL